VSILLIISAVKCVQGLCLWRNNSVEVNDELFKGSWRGNPAGMPNEIVAGLLKSSISLYILGGYVIMPFILCLPFSFR